MAWSIQAVLVSCPHLSQRCEEFFEHSTVSLVCFGLIRVLVKRTFGVSQAHVTKLREELSRDIYKVSYKFVEDREDERLWSAGLDAS